MANNTPYTGNYIFGENGIIIPDTADIQETVQTEYRQALGQDLSLEESTPQGRLIDVETTARQTTINFNAQIANVLINISMSTGTALDGWGANFGIPRNGATASIVPVLVTGRPDTVIPANAQAATDDGTIWYNVSEIIITDEGQATGTFICSQTGAITLGINELTTIVSGSTTGVNGWETITNTAVAEVGADRESDSSYKLRILDSLFSGSALFGNYASAVRKVANVKDVYVKENPYGINLILDNITIPAHSVYACVDGGNSYDVAYALYSIKSAGAGWTGNTTVTVRDKTFDTVNTVQYEIPADVNFSVAIDIANTINTSNNLPSEIKNVILNYFNGIYADIGYKMPGIRGEVSPFTIASLLTSKYPGIALSSIKVGLKTPQPHAVADIIKASTTGGILWASVNTNTFAEKISENGQYNFKYDGTNWILNSETVTLSEYGITVTGEPITNDVISIVYSTGQLSQSPIKIFATEAPAISIEDIEVNING